MRKSPSRLRAALFRGDRLVQIVMTLVVFVSLLLSLTTDIAARRSRDAVEIAARIRYGSISVVLEADELPSASSTDGAPAVTTLEEASATSAGFSFFGRRRGIGIADEAFVEWLAISPDEFDAVSTTWPRAIIPYEGVVWIPGADDGGEPGVRIPGHYVFGCISPCEGASTIVVDSGFAPLGAAGTEEWAAPFAADTFTQAFDFEEVSGVEAQAWPERVGVVRLAGTGAAATLLRPVALALGVLAVTGTLIVAVQGRAHLIRIAHAMGVPRTEVRKAVGRQCLMSGMVALLGATAAFAIAALLGLVTVSEVLRVGVIWYAIATLGLPVVIARLVAWRVIQRDAQDR